MATDEEHSRIGPEAFLPECGSEALGDKQWQQRKEHGGSPNSSVDDGTEASRRACEALEHFPASASAQEMSGAVVVVFIP